MIICKVCKMSTRRASILLMMSVDPGTKATGWAIWDRNAMVLCGLARGKNWIHTVREVPKMQVERLWLEDQQIYRNSNVDAHSLLAVSRVVGALAFHVPADQVELVRPAAWKGQVPKDVCNRRTHARLTPAEKVLLELAKCPKSLEHNLMDAIGIGLWAVKR